jgi:hypothetical protein
MTKGNTSPRAGEQGYMGGEAVVAQDKADAERYRFLRDGCGDKSIGVYTVAWSAKERTWLSGATLDAAIDAYSGQAVRS